MMKRTLFISRRDTQNPGVSMMLRSCHIPPLAGGDILAPQGLPRFWSEGADLLFPVADDYARHQFAVDRPFKENCVSILPENIPLHGTYAQQRTMLRGSGFGNCGKSGGSVDDSEAGCIR